MNWFDRLKSGIQTMVRKGMPENLWIKCERCHLAVYRKQVEQNAGTCPNCNAHFRIGHRQYLDLVVDEGSFQETGSEVKSTDALNFKDQLRYADRIKEDRKRTGLNAAVCTGIARINDQPVGIGIHEFKFRGGSLGSAEGERICRLIDLCLDDRLPLILVCRSGGARMQEGILSLMQLAKIDAKLAQFADEGLLFLSVLTDPTTAGVSASYALLGDVNIAEPNALIGFTGERITERSVGEEEMEGLRRAQRAEQVLEHGFVDMVVPRTEMRDTLARLISLLSENPQTSVQAL